MDYLPLIPWVLGLTLYFAAYLGQLGASPRADAPHAGFVLSKPITSALGMLTALGLAWVLRGLAPLLLMSAVTSAVALMLLYRIRGTLEQTLDGIKVRVPAHSRPWIVAQGVATVLILAVMVQMFTDYGSLPRPGR